MAQQEARRRDRWMVVQGVLVPGHQHVPQVSLSAQGSNDIRYGAPGNWATPGWGRSLMRVNSPPM